MRPAIINKTILSQSVTLFKLKGAIFTDFLKRTWAEIHLDRLSDNIEAIRTLIPDGTELLAVVKANGYGHDDETIAKHCERMGISHFAVSNIREAEKLRRCGIRGDIIILGYTPPECAGELTENNIIQAVFSGEYAERLSAAAKGGAVRCHIKLDTGMSRIGIDAEEPAACADEVARIAALPGLLAEGLFTHLAVADSFDDGDREFTAEQRRKILAVRDELLRRGISFSKLHFLNSAGGTYYPDPESSLARFGIMLYGLCPNKELPLPIKLSPVMDIKCAVSMVKTLPAGRFVSYGRTMQTDHDTVVATLPIGYADGYPRLLSNKAHVIINGKKAPVIGRICMDQMMVDISGIDGVSEGSIATVIGTDRGETVTADDLAALIGTIGYEIVCGISKRVPRVIMDNGEIVRVIDNY